MSIAKEAYAALYSDEPEHELRIKYSAKFNSYNANVYYTDEWMEFRLSKQWRPVSRDIKIGLLQTLLQKVFGGRGSTLNMDLYNIFLKKVHSVAPRTKAEPVLVDSFNRINKVYFNDSLEMPNLVFGRNTVRKLGSYEYGSDTIMISRILREHDELLDYVMYHELLHKKHKYYVKNGRTFHHTAAFRKAEKAFENSAQLEKKLSWLVRKKRFTQSFFGR